MVGPPSVAWYDAAGHVLVEDDLVAEPVAELLRGRDALLASVAVPSGSTIGPFATSRAPLGPRACGARRRLLRPPDLPGLRGLPGLRDLRGPPVAFGGGP